MTALDRKDLAELRELITHSMEGRDDCERCHGERGGVPGNENIVNGVVLCDYCHADDLQERLQAEVNEFIDIANTEIAAGRGPTRESVCAIYIERHPGTSADVASCAWNRMLRSMFHSDHFAER
jgi:hypothetical protein